MEMLLVFGALAVGGGIGIVFVAGGRALAAGRSDALEAILEDAPDLQSAELSRPFLERLLGPAFSSLERAGRAVTPAWWIERLRRNASLAGLGRFGLEDALAAKAMMTLVGIAVFGVGAGLAGVGGPMVWVVLGGAVGFFLPDVWVARRAESRQEEIRRTLPEALDLLAIAVQAGMGLEQAIALVAERQRGALGVELGVMIQEVQLGSSRRDALAHLRERTEVAELSTFALALAQADALGSPIGNVLRVQAVEMRALRRQRARERSAKVPVKLLFPLLLCVFPALGIVVVGPAAVSIVRAFG